MLLLGTAGCPGMKYEGVRLGDRRCGALPSKVWWGRGKSGGRGDRTWEKRGSGSEDSWHAVLGAACCQ